MRAVCWLCERLSPVETDLPSFPSFQVSSSGARPVRRRDSASMLFDSCHRDRKGRGASIFCEIAAPSVFGTRTKGENGSRLGISCSKQCLAEMRTCGCVHVNK